MLDLLLGSPGPGCALLQNVDWTAPCHRSTSRKVLPQLAAIEPCWTSAFVWEKLPTSKMSKMFTHTHTHTHTHAPHFVASFSLHDIRVQWTVCGGYDILKLVPRKPATDQRLLHGVLIQKLSPRRQKSRKTLGKARSYV